MQVNKQERLTAVRRKLEIWQVDAVLINSAANRRWLSGFTGSNAQLLISKDSALLATDFRYFERAKSEAPEFVLFKHDRQPADDRAFFQSIKAARIGIEQNHVTLAQAAEWRGLKTGIEWVPLPETVEPLRAIKTPAEIDIMRRAAAITDMAMSQFPHIARQGISEKKAAWELEKIIREAGADDIAFPIIVASGPNSALPHYTPGERPLSEDDVIIVDLGAKIDGYHSDLTRTFYLGDEPTPKFWEIFSLVSRANDTVFQQLMPGMTLKEADGLARDVITEANYAEYFGHGAGHGVGLEIHEDPFLSPKAAAEDKMLSGMNVTIEPGIYIPGWGGVRIEDFAYLTDEGLFYLSHCDKQPVIHLA